MPSAFLKLRALALASLLATVLALVAAAGAGAKPAVEVRGPSLRLKAILGFDLDYLTTIETHGHHKLTLSLTKGGVGASYTTNSARISRDRIEADLGELGRISLRFVPRAEPNPSFPFPRLPRRECRGHKPVLQVGHFTGTIEFDGEGGYTHLREHRAFGVVRRNFRQVCKRLGRPGGGRRDEDGPAKDPLESGRLALLSAVGHSGGRTVTLEALEIEAKGFFGELLKALIGEVLVAATHENHDGLRIVRYGLVFGAEGEFLIGPPKPGRVRATVAPEKPFTGTASYAKEPGVPATWIGTLGIGLPGVGPVPLVGPEFAVETCRIPLASLPKLGVPESPCLRRDAGPGPSARKLLLAQIRGSQSQDLGDARLSWSR